MFKPIVGILIFMMSLSAAADPKGSGTGCGITQMGPQGYTKAIQLSDKVYSYLETKYRQNGTEVALLGRAGSDSPSTRFVNKVSHHWNYTHAGLAYRHHPDGLWTVVHLLNDCGKKSNIYAQSLLKFFLDDPHEYRVVVGIPDKATQAALSSVIVDRNMATAVFNNSVYSSVSNPFNTERQNSNEYILDSLVLAIAYEQGVSDLFTREQVKDYMLQSGLVDKLSPEQVKVKGLESLGMIFGLGPKNVTLDDHPRKQRRKGKVEMVSVGTLLMFLEDLGRLTSSAELALKDIGKAQDTRYLSKD